MTFDLEDARSRLAALERPDAAAVRRDIEALAKPRLSGSDGAAEVERELRRRFEALGYRVEELGFGFSRWPGRFGLPLAGAVLAVTGGAGAWLLVAGAPAGALAVLIVGLGLALAPLLVLGRAIERLPWGRVESANLLFTRDDTRPSWVLMAHRDSKSQLVPTLVRTAALGLAATAWVALVVLAALWYGGPELRFPTGATIAGVILALTGILLALSWAGNTSPGALDNASGLAALLAVAEQVGGGDLAFLLTDGEELGLAGARDVAGRLPPVQGVLNVEGLDDDGSFYISEGVGWQRKGSAPQLAAALLTAGRALDLPVQRRPLPRSLLVDHLPIASAGIPSLTLLRGTWSSLLRVHRPGDDAASIRGAGAAEGAALLAGAFRLLREQGGSHLAGPRRAGS